MRVLTDGFAATDARLRAIGPEDMSSEPVPRWDGKWTSRRPQVARNLGIVSLALSIGAVSLHPFPLLNAILAALGVLLGGTGVVLATIRGAEGLSYSVVGTVINLVIFLMPQQVAALATRIIGDGHQAVRVVPAEPLGGPKPSSDAQDSLPPGLRSCLGLEARVHGQRDWAKPGTPLSLGDLRVSVTGAQLGPARLCPGDPTDGNGMASVVLVVWISVENTNPDKTIEYAGFRNECGVPQAWIVDEAGILYGAEDWQECHIDGADGPQPIAPGRTIRDALVFPPLPARAKDLRMVLQARRSEWPEDRGLFFHVPAKLFRSSN
jgi:hypothetical protein